MEILLFAILITIIAIGADVVVRLDRIEEKLNKILESSKKVD